MHEWKPDLMLDHLYDNSNAVWKHRFAHEARGRMVIRTKGFATSTGGREDDELAYAYCTDENGYCLSVCRFPDDELVEVMVVDQVNHKTREVAVELTRTILRLSLSAAAAVQLDGITEYTVPLSATDDELRELDAALTVIFEGGNRGQYVKRL